MIQGTGRSEVKTNHQSPRRSGSGVRPSETAVTLLSVQSSTELDFYLPWSLEISEPGHQNMHLLYVGVTAWGG